GGGVVHEHAALVGAVEVFRAPFAADLRERRQRGGVGPARTVCRRKSLGSRCRRGAVDVRGSWVPAAKGRPPAVVSEGRGLALGTAGEGAEHGCGEGQAERAGRLHAGDGTVTGALRCRFTSPSAPPVSLAA